MLWLSPLPVRFNEAVVATVTLGNLSPICASMRPWHFSHGNLDARTCLEGTHTGNCFNEAVAFQPRKFGLVVRGHRRTDAMLQ